MSGVTELVEVRQSARTDGLRRAIPLESSATDAEDLDWTSTRELGWNAGRVLRPQDASLLLDETWVAGDLLTLNYPLVGTNEWVMVVAGQNETVVNMPRVKLARPVDDKKRASMMARLRLLGSLPAGHDGERAGAPHAESVGSALKFVAQMTTSHRYSVTVNDEGYAVIEFDDGKSGFAGDITFLEDGALECYYRRSRFEPSHMTSGRRGDERLEAFLAEMGVEA